MPVEFLTDEQAAAYGRFVEEPTRPELERFFFLDDMDRDLIALRRTTAHHLGFAVQLCTLPWLGFVPDDVTAAPPAAVGRLADQLHVDANALAGYGEREQTRTATRREIPSAAW